MSFKTKDQIFLDGIKDDKESVDKNITFTLSRLFYHDSLKGYCIIIIDNKIHCIVKSLHEFETNNKESTYVVWQIPDRLLKSYNDIKDMMGAPYRAITNISVTEKDYKIFSRKNSETIETVRVFINNTTKRCNNIAICFGVICYFGSYYEVLDWYQEVPDGVSLAAYYYEYHKNYDQCKDIISL